MFLFDGFSWTVAAKAAAFCSDLGRLADDLIAATPQQLLPAWSWGRLLGDVQVSGGRLRGRVVRLRHRAVLTWLRTRTGSFLFDAPFGA